MADNQKRTEESLVQDVSPGYGMEAETTSEEEVPLGYKRTEVGVIPEDWNVRKVNEFGRVITGGTPSTRISSYWGNTYPWVTPTDISESKDICSTERLLSEAGLEILRKLPADTVLVTCIASIGKNAILKTAGACNQQINAIIPNQNYDSDFLYYLFSYSKEYLLGNAGTTATSIISKSLFSSLHFGVPTLPEQRAIATALSDADALIASLDRLIAKKRAIKQAAMQQLLTGQTRLPGFTGEWKTSRLGDLGTTYGGLTGKSKADFEQGSAHYVTFMNVMANTVINATMFERVRIGSNESQNTVLRGDLLFNGSSETPEEVAMCAFVQDELSNHVYLNSFCFGFRPHEYSGLNGLFFSYYMRSDQGREIMHSLAQGSTRYNLSKSAFMKLETPLPLEPEQTAIATLLSDMDSEIKSLQQRREKTRQIKQGMMQQLLTGRVRLIKPNSFEADETLDVADNRDGEGAF